MKQFWTNLIALAAVVTVNALANIIPINGQTTGEISNRLNVLFTPAGYVFSIWGLIYLLLGLWVLRGAFRSQRKRDVYKTTSFMFLISCILNISWILLWHYEFFPVSVAVIVGLLISIIIIYSKIKHTKHSFWDLLPFSVYMGWVSVAVVANTAYTVNEAGWDGLGISSVIWTVALLIVAAAIALGIRYKESDWVYPLVFIWAFIGIGVKNEGGESAVVFAAYVLSVVIFIGIFALRKKKKSSFSSRKLSFK
ncbi:tryptophan-rich sensory protein [Jeotgalibacillus salarius]|uniref:Tryptophan-rich sensory protein n=1 Tax=Jeotgalibacillus salarius TaxID=546023 RepID=A0A4Y8LBZ6_9BACL|nr:tryptophan-rich sensory protein [Jeotgalibacillus salarius]TFD99588.1 tryptophan-rich sensory protein [Jeotgalibacillus salarius]